MKKYNFSDRHIGPRDHDIKSMMKSVNVKSIEELIDKTILFYISLGPYFYIFFKAPL